MPRTSSILSNFLRDKNITELSDFFGAKYASEERFRHLSKESSDNVKSFANMQTHQGVTLAIDPRPLAFLDNTKTPQVLGIGPTKKTVVINLPMITNQTILGTPTQITTGHLGDQFERLTPFAFPGDYTKGCVVGLMRKKTAEECGFTYSSSSPSDTLSDDSANPPDIFAACGFPINPDDNDDRVVYTAIPAIIPLPRGTPPFHLRDIVQDPEATILHILGVENQAEADTITDIEDGTKIFCHWIHAVSKLLQYNEGNSLLRPWNIDGSVQPALAQKAKLTDEIHVDGTNVNRDFIKSIVILDNIIIPEEQPFGPINYHQQELIDSMQSHFDNALFTEAMALQGLELQSSAAPSNSNDDDNLERQNIVHKLVDTLASVTTAQNTATAAATTAAAAATKPLDAASAYSKCFFGLLFTYINNEGLPVRGELHPNFLYMLKNNKKGYVRRDAAKRAVSDAAAVHPPPHVRDYDMKEFAIETERTVDDDAFAQHLVAARFGTEAPRSKSDENTSLRLESFHPITSDDAVAELRRRQQQQNLYDQHTMMGVDSANLETGATTLNLDQTLPNGLASVQATMANFQIIMSTVSKDIYDPDKEPALFKAIGHLTKLLKDQTRVAPWMRNHCTATPDFARHILGKISSILYKFVTIAKAATIVDVEDTQLSLQDIENITNDAIMIANEWSSAAMGNTLPPSFIPFLFNNKRPASHTNNDNARRISRRTDNDTRFASSQARNDNDYQGVIRSRDNNGLISRDVRFPDI